VPVVLMNQQQNLFTKTANVTIVLPFFQLCLTSAFSLACNLDLNFLFFLSSGATIKSIQNAFTSAIMRSPI